VVAVKEEAPAGVRRARAAGRARRGAGSPVAAVRWAWRRVLSGSWCCGIGGGEDKWGVRGCGSAFLAFLP